jgi:D-alanyl-lipoteichoic acid acyltransferase DltB (MBOAT superfamily)
MDGLPGLQAVRGTAFPALVLLWAWPVFMLLPARAAPAFFIITGLIAATLVDGPLIAAGIALAAVVGYVLIEAVARMQRGRRVAFAALLAGLHAAYWACFWLPVPAAFGVPEPRALNAGPIFVLFSGIGLTFFRLVSYLHDRAWRGQPRVSARDFAACMLFLPQLRHGPLERATPFAERLVQARARWTWRDGVIGVLRIGWVLLVCLVVLELTAYKGQPPLRSVDVWAEPERLALPDLLFMLFVPACGLYVLESLFAHVSLGVGRVFGVVGTENYRYPLASTRPPEVWLRWNITLSHFLRDYAFTPLGGARRRYALNVVLTFVYCGLLHGLQWRALVWGLWTGVTLALWSGLEHWWRRRRRARRAVEARWRRPLTVAAGWALTYLWASVAVLILLDPRYFGWRLWRRLGQVLWLAIAG